MLRSHFEAFAAQLITNIGVYETTFLRMRFEIPAETVRAAESLVSVYQILSGGVEKTN